jgi:RNA polymerase sigma factor (sigma-70 family)
MQKQGFSDFEYIDGFRKKDNTAIRSFYSVNFQAISNYVSRTGGTTTEAEDVMQEGMLLLYESVQKEDFNLSSHLGTYFFAICKHIWLSLYKGWGNPLLVSGSKFSQPEKEQTEVDPSLDERRLLHFYRCFVLLLPQCQQIIKMRKQNISYAEIAKKFKLRNPHIARNKKHICMQNLIKLIKSHKDYKYLRYEK